MTAADILKRIESVKQMAAEQDDAKAHGMEDDLHVEVLEAIASGATNPEVLARTALMTRQIKFSRWTS